MDNTFEPSLPAFRNRIVIIEAIELSMLGFILWVLIALISSQTPDSNLLDLILFFVVTQGLLLGSWVIYNVYIRIARAGGRIVDISIWIIASLLTGTYTFWAWIILDINRWIVSRLLYRGEAPVEYAWSVRSKQVRKAWEQAQKARAA